MGFGISLISVILSIFVQSNLNERVREADGEIAKLTTSLSSQANEMNRAEIIQNQYTTLNHISRLAEGDQKKAATDDSIYMLQSYLDRVYLAVNDIPVIDVVKSTNEENAEALEFLADLERAKQIGNPAEIDRVLKRGEELSKRVDEPKTELGRKMAESARIADADKLADKSTQEIINEISPYLKTLNDQFIANYQKKEERIKKLQEKRAELSMWASIATYVAVSLQLFGLMFILSKDLFRDTRERRERDEREAKQADERGRLAAAEAKKATEEARKARNSLDQPRLWPRQEKEGAKESRDLLAELHEDLKSAVENVDRPKSQLLEDVRKGSLSK